jgi:hypothetical protein
MERMSNTASAVTAARHLRQAILTCSLLLAIVASPAVVDAQDTPRSDPEAVKPRPDPDRVKPRPDPQADARQADPEHLPIRPITSAQRRDWMVDGIVGPKMLATAVASATFRTAIHSPEEWTGSSGFAKRFGTFEAHVAISKSLEAGLGALWSEDPRSIRSRRQGFWPRLGFATTTVVMAPRADGRLAPAWGRMTGNVGASLIENAWLPDRKTTAGRTAMRVADGLLGRFLSNLWTEFGPDVRKKFSRNKAPDDNTVVAENR